MADSLLHLHINPFLQNPTRSNHHRPSHYRRPISTISTHLTESLNADIENYLRRAIPVKPPVAVSEPMLHLIFSPPPTTAPALCVAAAELVGGHRRQAMPAAAAIHLMHAAAYAHRHVTHRPENISGDHLYGANIELLSGDGIFPFAYELLAKPDNLTRTDSRRVLRVIVEIARAMGSRGWVEGEYEGVRVESGYERARVEGGYERALVEGGYEGARVEGEYEGAHVEGEYEGARVEGKYEGARVEGKYEGARVEGGSGGGGGDLGLAERVNEKTEGGLHACGGACGAILGGGSEEEIEKLRRYGLLVGIRKGLLKRVFGGKEKEVREKMEELRILAMKELESFEGEKVNQISAFLDIQGI